jgi:hypothetical protein
MSAPQERLALLAAAVGLISCASASFDGRVFKNDDVAFRIGELPESWREIEVDGALLAFRDDSESSTVAVNGRCGIDGDDVPLVALTHHLFLHFTDRHVESQTVSKLDGRDSLRTELLAQLDGVQRRFVIVVLKKDGCVYDFVWIAPPAATPDAEQSFDRFVGGFTTRIQG